MSTIGDCRRIAKSRKRKSCDWCNEWIDVGQPAVAWLWKDGADVQPTRVHPECYTALCEEAREWGYGYEFTPGDHKRGCTCEKGSDPCARCDRLAAAAPTTKETDR